MNSFRTEILPVEWLLNVLSTQYEGHLICTGSDGMGKIVNQDMGKLQELDGSSEINIAYAFAFMARSESCVGNLPSEDWNNLYSLVEKG